jgi:23S rRNA pseudouridine2605 synthase
MHMRLQKVLAQAGAASRRGSEELIRAGRVQVNGDVVTAMGVQVDPDRDIVTLDGRRLCLPERKRYVKLHKPAGYLCVLRDDRGRPALLDLVPGAAGLHPVGRLDLDSEGLVLLTDDGAVTERLAHPRYGHSKEYLVLVEHTPRSATLRALRSGIDLPDGRTAEAEVEVLQHTQWGRARRGQCWLRIVLHEGRKRQVRRMCDAVGHPVRRLIRVRIGSIELGDLPVGAWSRLSRGEIRSLLAVSTGPESSLPGLER